MCNMQVHLQFASNFSTNYMMLWLSIPVIAGSFMQGCCIQAYVQVALVSEVAHVWDV